MIYNRLHGERSACRHKKYGELAQLGARMTGSHEVTGSTPVFSTSFNMKARLKHWNFNVLFAFLKFLRPFFDSAWFPWLLCKSCKKSGIAKCGIGIKNIIFLKARKQARDTMQKTQRKTRFCDFLVLIRHKMVILIVRYMLIYRQHL